MSQDTEVDLVMEDHKIWILGLLKVFQTLHAGDVSNKTTYMYTLLYTFKTDLRILRMFIQLDSNTLHPIAGFTHDSIGTALLRVWRDGTGRVAFLFDSAFWPNNICLTTYSMLHEWSLYSAIAQEPGLACWENALSYCLSILCQKNVPGAGV